MAKKIPEFKSEKEEARFWDEHDSTEFIIADHKSRPPAYLFVTCLWVKIHTSTAVGV